MASLPPGKARWNPALHGTVDPIPVRPDPCGNGRIRFPIQAPRLKGLHRWQSSKNHRFWVGLLVGYLLVVCSQAEFPFQDGRRRSVTRGRQWQARTRLPHVVDSRRSPVRRLSSGRDQNGDKPAQIRRRVAVLDDETSWGRESSGSNEPSASGHGKQLSGRKQPSAGYSQRVAVNPIPPGVSRLPFLLAREGTPPYRRSPASGPHRRPGGHRRMRGTWPPRPVRPATLAATVTRPAKAYSGNAAGRVFGGGGHHFPRCHGGSGVLHG